MIQMTLAQSMLFRLLEALVGKEQIAFNMTVTTICGGELPSRSTSNGSNFANWVKSSRCLFTVTDSESNPKMVVELLPARDEPIDPTDIENRPKLKGIFDECGIRYVTFETEEVLNPELRSEFLSNLALKLNISDTQDPSLRYLEPLEED